MWEHPVQQRATPCRHRDAHAVQAGAPTSGRPPRIGAVPAVGLINLGNTCFLGIVHSLRAVTAFASLIGSSMTFIGVMLDWLFVALPKAC
eukprot:gene55800-9696_t